MLNREDLDKNLVRVQDWIKAADQKASIFLTFQGVVLTLLFADVFGWITRNHRSFSALDMTLIIIALVLIAYSLYKAVSSIVPRLAKDKTKKSITYFGDIAKSDLEAFKKAVRKITADEYEDELIEQIHISSGIAERKHRQFRDAIFIFFIGMGILALGFIIFKVYGG